MRVLLLENVADDQKGAVLDIDEGRARRLIRTGYARELPDKKPKKDA